jgi:CheY-like chemotaxis protein
MKRSPTPNESNHSTESQERHGLKVLIIEDHKDTAAAMAQLVQSLGHEVDVALDGHSALGKLPECLPDVVLLDIGLPGMDGYEVAKWIGEQPSDKKPLLVAVTGLAEDSHRQNSAAAGIDLHLVKPVDVEQLERLLSRFKTIIH